MDENARMAEFGAFVYILCTRRWAAYHHDYRRPHPRLDVDGEEKTHSLLCMLSGDLFEVEED
jgi:hypothetical protein